ncbi:hypothetical protein FACS1894181_17030 [Bacteroidia bacterium]|nr:hypothetical protein FACS1894181_17030 [Bacteroidia bacterium]
MPANAITYPVCIFTKSLQYLGYEALAETLAKAGYDGADLSVRPGGHVEPEKVKEDLPRLVNILEQAGVSVPMMVTVINNPADKYTEPVIATAADAGIKYYRMGYIDYDKRKTVPQNIDAIKKIFESLEKINRKYNIHGEYQNHSGIQVGSPVWDLYLLLKDFDPQHIGVQYDIRHAVVEGGEAWPLSMELLSPWSRTFPLKDFLWQKRLSRWVPYDVPLGEGMVNFDAYFRKYKELNLSGPFCIHLEYELGGAERGSREPTMSHDSIARYLKRDIDWLRIKRKEYVID